MRQIGRVILVGAGPGDPGLLTLRGKEALESAQVVLYDRLVGEEILALIPLSAELVDVGKSSDHHPVPQAEINALILRYAQAGKRVVRLKGGDPYLFGRGAEELEEIAARGIPFEVVPGITSAIAVPAYGGIPVSHRRMASSVHIITGHPRHGAEPSIDYAALVRSRGTLLFLMGVEAIHKLTAELLAAGMDPAIPAALIENGTRPYQRRLVSTVGEIAAAAVAQGFRPPSVLVAGEVCTLAETLDWFTPSRSEKPLQGVRVLVTRPKTSAGTLSSQLRELGCAVTEHPCIRIGLLPLPDDLFSLIGGFDWLAFTSPSGVEAFFSALSARRLDIRALTGIRLAAIGEKTAAALESRGLYPDLIPAAYNADALATELLREADSGDRVLLFRAKDGTPALPAALRDGGLEVEDVPAYETFYDSPPSGRLREALTEKKMDYLTFTSASTVEGFARSLTGLDCSGLTAVCIGEETARTARAFGLNVLVSEKATIESMVDRIRQEVSRRG